MRVTEEDARYCAEHARTGVSLTAADGRTVDVMLKDACADLLDAHAEIARLQRLLQLGDAPNLRAAIKEGRTTEALQLLDATVSRHRSETTDLLRRMETAKEAGRREGIEQAAKVADSWESPQSEQIAAEIRAMLDGGK